MASFKTKSKKKLNYDNRITLEAKHNEILTSLSEGNNKVDKMKGDIHLLKIQYNNLNNQDDIEVKLKLKDQIKDMESEVDSLKSREIDYYLDNGNLLFDYFDKVSNHQNKPVNNIKNIGVHGKKTVMEYFNKNLKNLSQTHGKAIQTKETIVEDYFFNIDENYVKQTNKVNVDYCEKCNCDKTLYLSEGKIICKKCGDESSILIDSDKPSYKDPPREVTYFSYKRINHFNEWLAQFQAKETTEIPQEVYDKILVELQKERIKDMNSITPKKIREILKKLKKNKYYEHVPHIINKLNGKTPPVMTREMEEELRRMFKEIQVPFHKFCPKDRKNFLSYSYVLRKFVELKEYDQFIPCFLLLKSRIKCYQQDIIWRDICNYLNWEFIPTV